jgi:hypothetical protein
MTRHVLSRATIPGYSDVAAAWSDEVAGAICSLTWQGVQFLDAKDHGRLLQSAVSFDGLGEACNPTEGGSAADSYATGASSSRLWLPQSTPGQVITACQMAYWLPVSGRKLSNVMLQKRLTLGYQGVWNAIEYAVSFGLPANETHTDAQFEHVTGYMPLAFANFYTLDRSTRVLTPLAATPAGEQPQPLVFANGTTGSAMAMGVWTPAGNPRGGYGRWNEGDCVKWNSVARIANPTPGGVYSFRSLIAFGSRDDVVSTLCGLTG